MYPGLDGKITMEMFEYALNRVSLKQLDDVLELIQDLIKQRRAKVRARRKERREKRLKLDKAEESEISDSSWVTHSEEEETDGEEKAEKTKEVVAD